MTPDKKDGEVKLKSIYVLVPKLKVLDTKYYVCASKSKSISNQLAGSQYNVVKYVPEVKK